MEITTLGIDLAKSVFQLHGTDAGGKVVLRKRLRRNQVLEFMASLPRCLVGIEACGTSHYWAREIQALGHDVRLIPPAYVKPYVKRQKNDMADAAAICEAVTRPSMHFVPVKTPEQQGVLVLHRTRKLLSRQRTMMLNAFRSHLAEFGIIAPKGAYHVAQLASALRGGEHDLPEVARLALLGFADQLAALNTEIKSLEAQLLAWHRESALSQRLQTIPGVGVLTATAMAASIPDATLFRSGRQFAAFLGLVPKQNSSGGKERLGGHLENGRPLPANSAGERGDLGGAPHHDCRGADRDLDPQIAGEKADPPRHGGDRQQDRPYRLGRHGARRGIPEACHGLKQFAAMRLAA